MRLDGLRIRGLEVLISVLSVSVPKQITLPPCVPCTHLMKGLHSTAQILRGSRLTEQRRRPERLEGGVPAQRAGAPRPTAPQRADRNGVLPERAAVITRTRPRAQSQGRGCQASAPRKRAAGPVRPGCSQPPPWSLLAHLSSAHARGSAGCAGREHACAELSVRVQAVMRRLPASTRSGCRPCGPWGSRPGIARSGTGRLLSGFQLWFTKDTSQSALPVLPLVLAGAGRGRAWGRGPPEGC